MIERVQSFMSPAAFPLPKNGQLVAAFAPVCVQQHQKAAGGALLGNTNDPLEQSLKAQSLNTTAMYVVNDFQSSGLKK
jgi:hypothetical protein